MIYFLSSLEINDIWAKEILAHVKVKKNLMSFANWGKKNALMEQIRDASNLVMIDSGAFTFQRKAHLRGNVEQKVIEYGEFIKKFDRPNIVGYMEMDLDNMVGYERVLEYRKYLQGISNKIIPIWHKRIGGFPEFDKICRENRGKIVGIGGFRDEDIKDYQYIQFVKHAKKYGVKLHALGLTRDEILRQVPFSYCDSSSWAQSVRYCNMTRLKDMKSTRESNTKLFPFYALKSYEKFQAKSDFYEFYWRNES